MTEPLVCACRTFELPNGYGLYEDGFIHTVDCCPVVRLRDMVPATTPPTTPSDAAMRAAEEVNETVSDEYALGFENGSAFAVAAFLENLGHLNYVFDGMDCCKICGLVKLADGWKKQCKGPTGLRIDAAATTSPETPVGGEDTEICPVCKNKVPLDSMWSYNNVPNAFCQECVDAGRV